MLHYPQLGGAGSDWTIEGHVWVYSLGTTGYRVILVLDTGSTGYYWFQVLHWVLDYTNQYWALDTATGYWIDWFHQVVPDCTKLNRLNRPEDTGHWVAFAEPS